MLEGVAEYGNLPDFRETFGEHLLKRRLIPENRRADSGRSDIWRDYQQLLKEWSLICEQDGQISLSPTGELFLAGREQEALQIAVFRFQYPNGYKLRFPKHWPYLSKPNPRPDSPDWASYLASNGVSLRPAVLIARMFVSEDHRRVTEMSATDIRDRLFRIIREPDSDIDLLSEFHAPISTDFGDGPPLRNAQEWMRSLAATGLFELVSSGRSLLLRPATGSTKTTASLVGMLVTEPRWQPTSGEEASETWYRHSQAPGANSSSLGRSQIDSGTVEDAQSSKAMPRECILSPYRRTRMLGVTSSTPKGFDSLAAQLSRRQSEIVHENIVEQLATYFRSKGLEPMSDPKSVDLLIRNESQVTIYEVKSVGGDDWSDRLRLAVGQILEYQSRIYHKERVCPNMCIVLSRFVQLPDHAKLHFKRIGIDIAVLRGGSLASILDSGDPQ